MTELVTENKLQLGQVLQDRGIVTDKQIDTALERQQADGHRKLLGELLVEMGYCSENQIASALAQAYGVPYAQITPKICDASVVEVSAFLPEQYYPRVLPGKTRVRLSVFDTAQGEYTVAYKSPTIHPKLRTFEIKCVLEKPPEGVVLGAMARLQIVLDQQTGPGVPAGAIQIRSGGPVVFVVEKDVAHMLPVEMGLESDGWVAVTAEGLSEDTPVVTMGQYNIEDGTPVAVQHAGEGA